MALPLHQEAANSAADLIEKLKRATGRPDDATLWWAVSCAAEIAPAVIVLIKKGANDVYLTPKSSQPVVLGRPCARCCAPY